MKRMKITHKQDQISPIINDLLPSFNNNGGSVTSTNPCSQCGTLKRKCSSSPSSSSSSSFSSSQSPNNLSFSNPNKPFPLQSSMASSSVSPSPTLPLLSPSAISSPSPRKIESLTTPTKFTSQLSSLRWRPSPSPSPPLLSLSSVSSPSPRKIESLLSTPTKSWQQIVSSAFPTPPDCVLSLSSGGGGGSQRKDSPLQSLGSPACNSALSPIRWRPSLSPSPSLSSPSSVLQSPPPPPPPRKPNSFSAPTNSRQGFISSASSTPLSSPTREAAHAKSNGGVGSTPRSAASKERWRRVRDGLEEMQHKWMMNNISQQLKQLNNEATPVITVNGKPNNDINNQEVNQTVSPGQNVERVQEAVQGENVSFDRDGDTIRICYMCCCGRQKQIFFGITN